jgi:hypothetical protein
VFGLGYGYGNPILRVMVRVSVRVLVELVL